MSRSIRLLALLALLIASALVLRAFLLPDGRAPVRLVPLSPHQQAAASVAASAPRTPPCTEADLAAWALPTPVDPNSPFVTLYSPTAGIRRVAQGTALGAQVVLERVSATEVVVACADGHLRRALTAPGNATAVIANHRPAAPLGN